MKLNYFIALAMLVATAVVTVSGDDILLAESLDLYGPLANNLRLVVIYLALIDLVVSLYCFSQKQFLEIVLLGAFMVLLIAMIAFYCRINQIEINPDYPVLLFYLGFSHMAFGLLQHYRQFKFNYFNGPGK